MNSNLMTISGLSALTKKTRRTVKDRLSDLDPARVENQATRAIRWFKPHEALSLIYAVDINGLDLTAERARLAKEQADKTEMENAVRRGELLDATEVAKAWDALLHAVKTRLLSIPTQIAPYLEGKTVPDIKSQLDDALYDALTELSDGENND